jgi:hypothetical protein
MLRCVRGRHGRAGGFFFSGCGVCATHVILTYDKTSKNKGFSIVLGSARAGEKWDGGREFAFVSEQDLTTKFTLKQGWAIPKQRIAPTPWTAARAG